MNNRKYLHYIEIIKSFLHYLLVFSIIGTGLELLDIKSNLLHQFFLLLPASYITLMIQKYTRHMWSFFLLQFLMIGGYLFLAPSPIYLLFYLPYLLFLVIFSFKAKLIQEEIPATNVPISLVLVFVLLYFVAEYFKLKEITDYLFYFLLLYVLLFFVNMYFMNFEKFFRTNDGLSNVPMQKIKSINHTLVLFFASLSLGVMLLFQYVPIKKLIGLLGNLLLTIIRLILSIFQRFGGEEEIPKVENTEVPIDFGALPDKDTLPSPLIEFLQKLITGLITFGVFALVIGLIIFSLFKLYKLFYEKKYSFLTDKTEFISPFDHREGIGFHPVKTILARFRPVYSSTPGGKIRKLFFKAVSSNSDSEDMKDSLTPEELSKLALGAQKEHILFANTDQEEKNKLVLHGIDTQSASANAESPQKQLTYYYEKARYGKEECSKEELQRVKNVLHRTR